MQSACHTKESLEKCTKQFAQIAVKNVKSRSSQIPVDQSTVENVGRREEAEHEEIDINTIHHSMTI